MNLPEWCQTHTLQEFLQLMENTMNDNEVIADTINEQMAQAHEMVVEEQLVPVENAQDTKEVKKELAAEIANIEAPVFVQDKQDQGLV